MVGTKRGLLAFLAASARANVLSNALALTAGTQFDEIAVCAAYDMGPMIAAD